jgi:hypothetical protein
MRSGNSFFRTVFEAMTGIVTGATSKLTSSCTLALSAAGFKGEAVVDEKTWLIKSHYPYRYPMIMPMQGTKSIIIVRNPFDTLVSLF